MRCETIKICVFVIVVLAGGPKCFDPDYGNKPFRCQQSAPDATPTGNQLCPSGYTCLSSFCVPLSVAASSDAGTTSGDAIDPAEGGSKIPFSSKEGPINLDEAVLKSSVGCDDETTEKDEGNNSIATASDMMVQGVIPGWEICYAGDADVYGLLLKAGENLFVKISFTHKSGDLDAAILDPDGFVVASSRSENDDELLSINEAKIDGKYFIVVFGFGGATNKYSLEIKKN